MFRSFLSISLVALLSGCSLTEKKICRAYFWTQGYPIKTELLLYINDSFRGNISHTDTVVTCAETERKKPLLNFNLPNGIYTIKVKNKSGQILSAGKMELTEDNMTLKGEAGGMDARQTEDCLMVEIL